MLGKTNGLSTFLKTKNATAFVPIYAQHLLNNLNHVTCLSTGLEIFIICTLRKSHLWWYFFLVAQTLKNLLQCRKPGFHPWVRKIPWWREWQPIPVLLLRKIPRTDKPGEIQSMGLHRVRHDWSDLAEQLTHTHTHTHTHHPFYATAVKIAWPTLCCFLSNQRAVLLKPNVSDT